jgi:hypothetical protein
LSSSVDDIANTADAMATPSPEHDRNEVSSKGITVLKGGPLVVK